MVADIWFYIGSCNGFKQNPNYRNADANKETRNADNIDIFINRTISLLSGNYVMPRRAFVVSKKVFIMETVVFWHCYNG